MAQKYRILDGPSKFDLMMALFDRASSGTVRGEQRGAPRMVTFTVRETPSERVDFEMGVSVHAVAAEGEHGDTWILKVREKNTHSLLGHYRTDTRKGELEIE